MRDPFANYDAWLERPYQDMIEDSDDPEDMKQAELDYDAWLYDCEEAKAEAQYEAYLDRLEMEAQEREWDDRW